MTLRHRTSHASFAYLIALLRLRLVRDGAVWPREDEPVDLMMMLVIA